MTIQATTSTVLDDSITVLSVSHAGARVSVRGSISQISWSLLRAAASQDDAALASVYSGLLSRAEEMAADESPITVYVEQDHTNVWWLVRVRAAWGGGRVRLSHGRKLLRADEGGSHAHRHHAEVEATDIRERLASTGREVRS